MCGIAGIYLKNPDDIYLRQKEIETTVDWLFCGIENRGTHASGIAVQSKTGETYLEKSDMPASKFIFWRRDIPVDPRIIILHTRWATKGKPENLLNNHPIEYKNVMAVHNGHISNDDELFESEELDRIAEVDSEIIPALLHKYTFANPREALEKMIGGFAIAAFDSENPGTLLLAKGQSSPLVWIETDGMFMWASEEKFLKDALEYGVGYEAKTSEFRNMPYGRFAVINGDNMQLEDFQPAFKTYVSTPYSYTKAWDKNVTVIPRETADGWNSKDWYSNSARDKCDECFVWYPTYQLNRVGEDRYCDHCEAKLFDIDSNGMRVAKPRKRLSRKEKKRLRKEAQRRFREEEAKRQSSAKTLEKGEVGTISDALDVEHWNICNIVANYYGTKPELVDSILFSDMDIEDFDDPSLVSLFLEFQDKYQETLEEVRGETDYIIEALTVRDDKGRFPVGF